jgi:hypothetical protein
MSYITNFSNGFNYNLLFNTIQFHIFYYKFEFFSFGVI